MLPFFQQPQPEQGDDEGSRQPYIVGELAGRSWDNNLGLWGALQLQPFVLLLSFAGIQSAEQQELLARHGPERPVFVEGPFPVWLRSTRLLYYVLRGDPVPPHLRVS